MRILVIEDDLISRMILSENLSEYGHCDIAVDGEEGVKAVKYALANRRYYHLICVDIHMPKLSGFEVLRAIRTIEKSASIPADRTAKIIMTTGDSDKQTVIRALKEGCNGYLVKPIEKEVIRAQLEKLGLQDVEAKSESPAAAQQPV